MRILFYLPFINTGGIQVVSLVYLQGLIDNGYQVDLLIDFDMGKAGNMLEKDIPNEISFQYIKPKIISNFIYMLRTLGKKYKIVNVLLYASMIFFDFYYYHTKVKGIVIKGNYNYSISFYQFLPAYITSIKVTKHILWIHGSITDFLSGTLRFFTKSFGVKLNKYDFVITIANKMNEQVTELYPTLPLEKLKTLHNPFDIKACELKGKESNGLSKEELLLLDSNYICSVGRLDEKAKDFTTLIKAYEQMFINGKIKDKLLIIGDGIHKSSLENLVREKKLIDQIHFLGNKSNPIIWMKKATLFILSSKSEGFSLVLIEAMIVRTFVISSNCRVGPEEILEGGKCGDLFSVGDVSGLASAIEYALSHDEYRNNKIQKAYAKINDFDKDNILKKLNDLLKQ